MFDHAPAITITPASFFSLKAFVTSILFLFSLVFFFFPASAFSAPSERKLFTLESALERAIERSPLTREAGFNIERADSELKKIKIKKFSPDIKVKFTTGLVPEARGSVFSSSDNVNDLNGLGPFYQFNIEMIKPLFTFGRLGAAVAAGNEGVSFARSKRELITLDLSLKVIEAYWGFYFATKGETLATDFKEKFTAFLSTVKERLDDEDSSIDDSDYLKLKSSAFMIEEQYQKAVEFKKMSRLLLITLLDLDPDHKLEFSFEKTPKFRATPEEFGRVFDIVKTRNPLLNGVNSAVNGLKAKIELSKSHRYPVIFLAARFRYAEANNRTDQTNPFVVDDFNFREIGAALGVEWKPDFWSQKIEIKKIRLEHLAALEKKEAITSKVNLEAKMALLKIGKNKTLLTAVKKSVKSAKSWIRTSADNWEMGLGDFKNVLEAYKTYYSLRGIEIERENQYNASLAKLAYTVGDMKLYLRWLKEGRVQFD